MLKRQKVKTDPDLPHKDCIVAKCDGCGAPLVIVDKTKRIATCLFPDEICKHETSVPESAVDSFFCDPLLEMEET